MGAYRTARSPGQAWWPQAQGRCARSREWDYVRIEHGMPMALCAKDLPPKSTLYDYFDLWTYMARWRLSITRFM